MEGETIRLLNLKYVVAKATVGINTLIIEIEELKIILIKLVVQQNNS